MSTQPTPVKIPITNVYGGGDYTGAIQVGSHGEIANVILDTGSSTLAVKPTAYDAAKDTDLQATALAQDILYGTGGWVGPVVHTTVGFAHTHGHISLKSTPIAICDDEQQDNFYNADGIMGLAFSPLNTAYDVIALLQKMGTNPAVTYPWPFKVPDTHQGVVDFIEQLRNEATEQSPTPYFSLLEGAGVVANKLAFYTKRSCIHFSEDHESLADGEKDPLNQGYLILGGGEEETGYYEGAFQEVQVVDDMYYNVNLMSVKVGDQPAYKPLALQPQYSDEGSNAVVDSGTNHLALAFDVYEEIIKAFNAINPNFVPLIHRSGNHYEGIPSGEIDLTQWPEITLGLEGPNGDCVELLCAPDTYWQTNYPKPGYSYFNIYGSPRMEDGEQSPNQSVLGLTLMNNYYTIFDRSADAKGVIKFAKIVLNA